MALSTPLTNPPPNFITIELALTLGLVWVTNLQVESHRIYNYIAFCDWQMYGIFCLSHRKSQKTISIKHMGCFCMSDKNAENLC